MRAVFLEAAELDLKDLRNYILKRFGKQTWQESYRKIKESVRAIETFPQGGSMPDELIELNLAQFRHRDEPHHLRDQARAHLHSHRL